MTKILKVPGKFRCLVVPTAALAVIAAVTAAGMVETRAERAATCGLAIHVQDPDLRQASSRSTGINPPRPARPAISTAAGIEPAWRPRSATGRRRIDP